MEPQNKPGDKDLKDSPSDEERLKPETGSIELPEVKDIPGQEHVHMPPLGELGDTTTSSDDEEDTLNGDSLDENGPADEEDTIGIP